ncbi:MAG TPA: hypothetical protein VMS32_06505 [Verrucomicrobiae bacterium]|jgi:lysophospholipase L1-like esterase|nr:hypothetical protein [Verrucomicrobiae bacterium]
MHHRDIDSVESVGGISLHIHGFLRDADNGITQARWWLCVPVALLCLLLVDVGLSFWRPAPERLPEQFSSAYLQRYVVGQRGRSPIVFLGDSMLWGYRLRSDDAAASLLRRQFSHQPIVNLSYEGGSSANTYFMLRYLLASGVRPALVVFNVNSKETNIADSAYSRLHPSLEALVTPLLSSADRKLLTLQPAPTLGSHLEADVASVWQLYRYRTDLREALFGTDDAAGALRNWLQELTGSAALQAQAHRPTTGKFLGTYDLAPLGSDNVDFTYLKKISALLRTERISAVAFLTPTNHVLLNDYIGVPEYDQKLRQLETALRQPGTTVLNLDRTMLTDEFLDNDHLTVEGNRRLAALLAPAMQSKLPR